MVSEIWVPQSLTQVLPHLTSFCPGACPYGTNGQITMTLHNYRSRQVHGTLNGVNPSSSFRDMRSAKSGSNLWQIWQVFGPWASPYGANGHMTMTVHTYRPRQFHRTSNGENPSSGYRDMGSASLAAARPAALPPGPWRQYPSSPEGWGVKSESWWTKNNRNYITVFKNNGWHGREKYMHLLNYSIHHIEDSVTAGRHSNFQSYIR